MSKIIKELLAIFLYSLTSFNSETKVLKSSHQNRPEQTVDEVQQNESHNNHPVFFTLASH